MLLFSSLYVSITAIVVFIRRTEPRSLSLYVYMYMTVTVSSVKVYLGWLS